MRIIPLQSLLLAMLLAVPALGREIYVDNVAGDDRFTGILPRNTPEQNGPVRTLAQALRLAQHGDTIVLARNDQPYYESVSLVGSRNGGDPGRPFAIRGNGAILDGSKPIDPRRWKHYEEAVFSFTPRRMSHQQLFLDGRPVPRVAVPIAARRPPKLEPLQWCSLNGVIYFCAEKNKLPDEYNLSCAERQTGITLFHVDNVLIADLTVQGFQLDGVNLSNSARNITLSGLMCRGNGRSGVAVGGASTVVIDDCAGQQRLGPTPDPALLGHAGPQIALAGQHRAGLGRSWRARRHRRKTAARRSRAVPPKAEREPKP